MDVPWQWLVCSLFGSIRAERIDCVVSIGYSERKCIYTIHVNIYTIFTIGRSDRSINSNMLINVDQMKSGLVAEEALEKAELSIETQLKGFELKRTKNTIIENIRRDTSILTDSALMRLILQKSKQDYTFINRQKLGNR